MKSISENKICSKCKQLKSIAEFHKYKTSKDGLKSWCKDCAAKSNREWYQQSSERRKRYRKEYYKANMDKIRAYNKKRRQEKTKYYKKYRETHREHMRNYWREYYHKKLREDIKYRLNNNISRAIRHSLRGNKNGQHWEGLIECTLDELRVCMEKQWTEGMTWDNYGMWHIDHKIPISAFNFDSPDHIDFKKCWALSNLQPMWAKDNISKHAKIEQDFQPSLKL